MKIIIITVILINILVLPQTTFALGSEQIPDCSIDMGPCFKTVQMRTIQLDIAPRPVKTMNILTFTVNAIGKNIAPTLLLSLSMPGMFMSRNEVILKKRPDGSYSGKGMLPHCPSGKNIWRAEIIIPGAGKASFTFNVSR